ncbi:hypothetical protein H3C61_03585 [Candidatus Gracilibacteria bacterium]|nr:hypothetical protein [Candidatus Gracilibacteria bacterium]
MLEIIFKSIQVFTYIFCHQTFISTNLLVVSVDNLISQARNIIFKNSALVIHKFGLKVLSPNQLIIFFDAK